MASTFDQRAEWLLTEKLTMRSATESFMRDYVEMVHKQRDILVQLNDETLEAKFGENCREFYLLEIAKETLRDRISTNLAKELRIDITLQNTYSDCLYSQHSPRAITIDNLMNTKYKDLPFSSKIYQSYMKYRLAYGVDIK